MNDSADATTPMTTAAVTTERAAVAAAGHLGDETTARTVLASDPPTIRPTALGALEPMASLTDDDVGTAVRKPPPLARPLPAQAITADFAGVGTRRHDADVRRTDTSGRRGSSHRPAR